MEIACRSAFQFWKVLWATSSHELGLLPLWSEHYCKGQHGPLFSLLEAVEVGNRNSTACRWRSWPGLWLLLACGGAMWSVSYPVIYLHFAFNSKMEGGKKEKRNFKIGNAITLVWGNRTPHRICTASCSHCIHPPSHPTCTRVPVLASAGLRGANPTLCLTCTEQEGWVGQVVHGTVWHQEVSREHLESRQTHYQGATPALGWSVRRNNNTRHLCPLAAAEETSEGLLADTGGNQLKTKSQ